MTLSFLKGKRTYIAAVVGVVVVGLYSQGYLNQHDFEIVSALFGFLGLGFLRAARQ